MLAGLHWFLRLKSVLFDTFRSRHNKVWPSMSYLIACFLLISYRIVNDVYSNDKKNYCFPCQFDLIFLQKKIHCKMFVKRCRMEARPRMLRA